ncbi:hypothetical protein ACGFJT_36805 [Actinomadura geliboluensis]|uniref:hypothetical protein n=1 Tax=Actinomadura geliboluensis TaxID=882440 RepID=UPI00370F9A47
MENNWPEWRKQARVVAAVLKEHLETAADYGEGESYRMEGMTECPEMLDRKSIQESIDNILDHAERARVQLDILQNTIPKDACN